MSRWPAPTLPGMAVERTRLSWVRTTLACAVVTLMVVRQVLHDRGTASWLLALGAAAACVLALVGTLRGPRGPVAGSGALVAGAVVVTAAVWVFSLVLGA